MILSSLATIQPYEKTLKKTILLEFDMTDIGLMPYYLGLRLKQIEDDILISH